MKHTNEQKAIFDCIENTENHLIVSAGAGTGKTTTIVEAAELLPMEQKRLSFVLINLFRLN